MPYASLKTGGAADDVDEADGLVSDEKNNQNRWRAESERSGSKDFMATTARSATDQRTLRSRVFQWHGTRRRMRLIEIGRAHV